MNSILAQQMGVAEAVKRARTAMETQGQGVATTTLPAALVAAQQAAVAVAKDSTNPHFRYNYTSAETIIAEARAALNSSGLSLSPVTSTVRTLGEQAVLCSVYRLEHMGGEYREICFEAYLVPDKGRPMDKALAAARTNSLGYVLRDLLLLPRVEEHADVDQRDDSQYAPPASPAAAPPRSDTLHADPLARPDGDGTVPFSPNKWKGDNYKGRLFSECPGEFLEMLADALAYSLAHPKPGSEKFADRNRQQAALCAAWARYRISQNDDPIPF